MRDKACLFLNTFFFDEYYSLKLFSRSNWLRPTTQRLKKHFFHVVTTKKCVFLQVNPLVSFVLPRVPPVFWGRFLGFSTSLSARCDGRYLVALVAISGLGFAGWLAGWVLAKDHLGLPFPGFA